MAAQAKGAWRRTQRNGGDRLQQGDIKCVVDIHGWGNVSLTVVGLMVLSISNGPLKQGAKLVIN